MKAIQTCLACLVMVSLMACNTYAVVEYTSLLKQDYTCECVAADGTIVGEKTYAHKTRKVAEQSCATTEDVYRQNNQKIICSLK